MSKTVSRALAGAVRLATCWQSEWRRSITRLRTAGLLAEHHSVDTKHGRIVFRATHPQALDYPRGFFDREPETLAWIESFVTPCDFWDVGANIGAYALYAGLRPQSTVLAFEPAAGSYAALCENIRLNRLDERVRSYCLALCDRPRADTLNMQYTNPGSVMHGFAVDETFQGAMENVQFRQGAIGFSIDALRSVFCLEQPNYLKIDVDGIEESILVGARATIADPNLRGVLVEIDQEDTRRGERVQRHLESAGLNLVTYGEAGGHGSRNAIFARATGVSEPVARSQAGASRR
jgi:FkbM family methyltransferase